MLAKLNWMTVVNAVILLFVAAIIIAIVQSLISPSSTSGRDALPFYSTADAELQRAGSDLYRKLKCRNCHAIWGARSLFQSVPAPSLDGIGSLRSEEWLYRYFSSENPQAILPSRLKKEYRMPSYAYLPKEERMILARYFASLKVKDWYLDEVKKAEQKALTGE